MAYLWITHKVVDYPKWKTTFDKFADTRKKGGEKAYTVYSTDGDTNNVSLLFEWDSEDNARTFLNSKELRQTMERAGVSEQPEIHFLKQRDSGTL